MMTEHEQRTKEEVVLRAIEMAGLDAQTIAAYLKEKVREDRSFNDAKIKITEKNEYYSRKALLSQIEYLILILQKNKRNDMD